VKKHKEIRHSTLRRRDSRGEGQAYAEAGPGDGVGKQTVEDVGDDKDQHETREKQPFERGDGQAKFVVGQQEEQAGSKLDYRVHRRYRETTVAAFATKENPAQDRDVVVRLDGDQAARAAGAWRNYGQAFRNACDANIQKAADDQAEKEKEEGNHRVEFDTDLLAAQCAGKIGVSDG